MKLQNLHTHSHFCDGKNSVEEMIQSALSMGFDSLGFSSHSWLPFYSRWSMQDGVPHLYRAEVLRQKERYANRIAVFLGLEQDYYSPKPDADYEYLIGSVHYVKKDGHTYPVDHSAETLVAAARASYGGDVLALIEDYYALVADVARQTGCQILGHFDLICKYNEANCVFDTGHPRYVAAAMNALDALTGKNLIFEINTGAMARGKRTVPYPSRDILLAMRERDMPICISSDAHNAENLCYGFRQAVELARECGYKECMYWEGKAFAPGPLPD